MAINPYSMVVSPRVSLSSLIRVRNTVPYPFQFVGILGGCYLQTC